MIVAGWFTDHKLDHDRPLLSLVDVCQDGTSASHRCWCCGGSSFDPSRRGAVLSQCWKHLTFGISVEIDIEKVSLYGVVCICICTHTHIYIIYIYISYIYIHTYTYTYACACSAYIYIYIYNCMSMCVWMYLYIISIYIFVVCIHYMHVYSYAHIYIYTRNVCILMCSYYV